MDHLYLFTITGLCGRCGAPQADHPTTIQRVDQAEHSATVMCPIDHGTLIPALRKTERGLEWLRCPQCNVQVEEAQVTGVVQGNPYGRGRGELTARHRIELEGMAGWWAFNGGDVIP